MQFLAALSVRRPVFTWVLMLAMVVVGISSMLGLGVDRFPNIDFPIVIVSTQLPGAAPQQVETEVTDLVEEALNSVSGLDQLTSNSYEGLSVVIAQFNLEKSVTVAAQEVRDKVNLILSELPDTAKQPQVQQLDPAASPIMQIALITNRSKREATDYADRVLKRRLESILGVGGVTITGGRERTILVTVDPGLLNSFGLTVQNVQSVLATENLEVPGGNVEEGARTVQLRVQGRVQDPAEFARIPIAQRNGRTVTVGDVATVEDGEAEPESSASLNGEQVIMVAVRKQSGTNTVAVIDALYERLEEIKTTLPPAYRVQVVRDEKEFVANAIHSVQEHLVLGGLLAALVVLLFLWNGRSTVIAALAIPTSIIATFTLINAMGMTLNLITLLALTLAVGIVIDDAIVVLENIVRFIEEKGYSAREASVVATKEIGLAVLATSLSLVAVFLPIAFIGGVVGRFMAGFGYTMSFAILISMFVSFTLTPMLSSRWLKGPKYSRKREANEEEEAIDLEIPDPKPESRKEEKATYALWYKGERSAKDVAETGGGHGDGKVYQFIERSYLKLLAFCMTHRWVLGIVIVIALASIPIVGKRIPGNFLPSDDESRFEMTIRAPEGTSLAQTQLITERIARSVRQMGGVERTLVTVGAPAGDPSGRGVNEASVFVALVPPHQRRLSQVEFVQKVRNDVLPAYRSQGIRALVSEVAAIGGGGASAAPIQYVLSGPDIDKLAQYADQFIEVARGVPDSADVDTTLVVGRPSYEVRIDRARAADLSVPIANISSALRLLVGGVDVTNFNAGGEQYDVNVRANLDWRNNPQVISQIMVPSLTGRTVRLSDVAELVPSSGPASIQHLGRQRQVTVYATVKPGGSEQTIVNALNAARDRGVLEPGYSATLVGRSKELAKTMRGFLIAIGLSFVFMYLVLAAQFESWIHPVTILVSLPLTVPFALLSLLIFQQSLNIFSMLGILVLFGVVKKNAILQVDHTRALRRKGLSRADAVMLGNRDRLRPILMTTIAFVAGMIPLLVSSGAGSGTNRAIGSIIAGGQTFSLILTLVATPVVFSWFDDISHSRAVAFIARMIKAPILAIDRIFDSKTEVHDHDQAEHPAE